MRMLMRFDGVPSEPGWVAVNDGVMGGRSSGAPAIVAGTLHFTGILSLANNGGFSSIRTVRRSFDLAYVTALVLRVRGDGRAYQLRLKTDATVRGIAVAYSAPFTAPAGRWTEARVPLDQLRPSVRGTTLDGPPFEPTNVTEIGLLIGDHREGPFALAVDWIGMD
ncbi:MAG: CIA30 family protein [Dokdonella sp.]|uniref:CIA30 family protein n=1 Tax=Dokdonella sp. TaxID=2291710 RepID=UPI003263F6D4